MKECPIVKANRVAWRGIAVLLAASVACAGCFYAPPVVQNELLNKTGGRIRVYYTHPNTPPYPEDDYPFLESTNGMASCPERLFNAVATVYPAEDILVKNCDTILKVYFEGDADPWYYCVPKLHEWRSGIYSRTVFTNAFDNAVLPVLVCKWSMGFDGQSVRRNGELSLEADRKLYYRAWIEAEDGNRDERRVLLCEGRRQMPDEATRNRLKLEESECAFERLRIFNRRRRPIPLFPGAIFPVSM